MQHLQILVDVIQKADEVCVLLSALDGVFFLSRFKDTLSNYDEINAYHTGPLKADSEVMDRVNTEDSPYELSLEIIASDNAAANLIAGSSVFSAITESDARLGGSVSLSYYGGDVEKVNNL